MKNDDPKKPIKTARIILLILILIGLGCGLFWYLVYFGQLYTNDAAIQTDHAAVSFKTSGRIRNLYFSEGDTIQKGNLMGELDDADLMARKTILEQGILSAQLNYNLAGINLEKARNDFQRIDNLSENSKVFTSVSRENYDNALRNLEAAKVQLSIAEGQITLAEDQLHSLEIQIQNLKILAPLSGTIVNLNTSEGEIVQPGQQVYQINNLSHFWIMANFEETVIQEIPLGKEVSIQVDAYPKQTFTGVVSQIRAAIVPPPFSIGEGTKTTQKIPVRVDFEPVPQGTVFRPGMSVEVKIHIK